MVLVLSPADLTALATVLRCLQHVAGVLSAWRTTRRQVLDQLSSLCSIHTLLHALPPGASSSSLASTTMYKILCNRENAYDNLRTLSRALAEQRASVRKVRMQYIDRGELPVACADGAFVVPVSAQAKLDVFVAAVVNDCCRVVCALDRQYEDQQRQDRRVLLVDVEAVLAGQKSAGEVQSAWKTCAMLDDRLEADVRDKIALYKNILANSVE
ncbi:hypothetical protein RI367_007249 [Sorochytrium milnesiophthora]